MILAQKITLEWYKDCRGGLEAVRRNQFPQAAKLPLNFFDYIPFGSPVHWMLIEQKPDGFHTIINRRDIEKFDCRNSLHLSPMEIIPKDDGHCEIRYRYDWHKGAIPERQKFIPAYGRYLPLNELAMELSPGDYGRAICNGRFVDRDTGNWWYEQTIVNIIILVEKYVSPDCFLMNSPTHYYRQIAQLR